MDLSIIIPAFNEAERLPATLEALEHFLRGQSWSFEVIVVNDGSTDRTSEVVKQAPLPIRLIQQDRNLGKGAAVRTGMMAAQGEWRYLCDADLSTPITELERFWASRHQADIVIGSRRTAGASIGRHQAIWKEVLGKCGNVLIQILAAPGIHDTQCGFKLFHERTRSLFERQRLNRWGYDFEILFLARRQGFKILEMPVSWVNDARSKVRGRDYLTTLLDLVRIHYYNARGFYRR